MRERDWMQYTIKLKRETFSLVLCSPHLPLLFIPLSGFTVFAPTPRVKIKNNYFKRQPFFFLQAKQFKFFHVIAFIFSCREDGGLR